MENCSSDDTVEVAKTYCQKNNLFKLHILDTIGVSNARNKGIDLSQGKFIAFVQLSFVQYNLKNGKTKPMVVYNSSDIITLDSIHYPSLAVNVAHKVIKADIIKNNNIKF